PFFPVGKMLLVLRLMVAAHDQVIVPSVDLAQLVNAPYLYVRGEHFLGGLGRGVWEAIISRKEVLVKVVSSPSFGDLLRELRVVLSKSFVGEYDKRLAQFTL